MRFNNYNTYLIENFYHRLIIQNKNCPQNKTPSQKDFSVKKNTWTNKLAPPTHQPLFAFYDQ